MTQEDIKGKREGCSEGIKVGWLEREGTKKREDDRIIVVKVFTFFLKKPFFDKFSSNSDLAIVMTKIRTNDIIMIIIDYEHLSFTRKTPLVFVCFLF